MKIMILRLFQQAPVSQFNTKDGPNKQHKHDLVCFSKCASATYTDSYIREIARSK